MVKQYWGRGLPDPFPTYRNRQKFVHYDRMAREWWMNCGCCGEIIYAPTRKTLRSTRLYHSRNICLGGY